MLKSMYFFFFFVLVYHDINHVSFISPRTEFLEPDASICFLPYETVASGGIKCRCGKDLSSYSDLLTHRRRTARWIRKRRRLEPSSSIHNVSFLISPLFGKNKTNDRIFFINSHLMQLLLTPFLIQWRRIGCGHG